jgi:hypothetical protein
MNKVMGVWPCPNCVKPPLRDWVSPQETAYRCFTIGCAKPIKPEYGPKEDSADRWNNAVACHISQGA